MRRAAQNIEDEVFQLHSASDHNRFGSRAFALQINEHLTRADLIEAAALARYRGFATMPLPWPSPVALTGSFADAVRRRRSHRAFASTPLSMADLSTLFSYAMQSSRKAMARNTSIQINFGPYPSAGGLFPIDVFVALFNTELYQDTLCWYDPLSHELRPVQNAISREAWRAAMMSQADWLDNVGAAVVFTARWARTTGKYGLRGYRFALLEAGAAAQSLMLACGAMGHGSLLWGAYVDAEVQDLLGIEPMVEAVVNVGFIGTVEDQGSSGSDENA